MHCLVIWGCSIVQSVLTWLQQTMRWFSKPTAWMCSVKTLFLKFLLNWKENICARSKHLVSNFIKKETLAKVISGEFSEIFKNTYRIFTEHPSGCFWILPPGLKNLQFARTGSGSFVLFERKHDGGEVLL